MSLKVRSLLPVAAVAALGLLSAPTNAVKGQLSPCSAGEFDTELSDNKVFVAWFPGELVPNVQAPACRTQRARRRTLAGEPSDLCLRLRHVAASAQEPRRQEPEHDDPLRTRGRDGSAGGRDQIGSTPAVSRGAVAPR